MFPFIGIGGFFIPVGGTAAGVFLLGGDGMAGGLFLGEIYGAFGDGGAIRELSLPFGFPSI